MSIYSSNSTWSIFIYSQKNSFCIETALKIPALIEWEIVTNNSTLAKRYIKKWQRHTHTFCFIENK